MINKSHFGVLRNLDIQFVDCFYSYIFNLAFNPILKTSLKEFIH